MRADKVKGLMGENMDIPIAIKKKTAKEMTSGDVYNCGKIAGANATRSTIGSKELVLCENAIKKILDEEHYHLINAKLATALSSRIEDVLKVRGEK